MEYVVYKMVFPNGVHFGNKTIESSEFTFAADTLFSALCQEALKCGEKKLKELYEKTRKGDLLFSDGFPYIGNTYYIPKPMLRIEKEQNGNSIIKKAFKKLTYIPITQIDLYLKGDLDVVTEKNVFGNLGYLETKTLATNRGEEETVPYQVGVYYFNEHSGLYVIIGYNKEEDKELIEELMMSLSYSGIGGRRHSGLGRFELYPGKIDVFNGRLSKIGNQYMTLSVSLPKDEELESVLENARYTLQKRSGFVASYTYAQNFKRKKDLFVLSAGACVKKRFVGDIYDVSGDGEHPVYRYAKPMFLEVSI